MSEEPHNREHPLWRRLVETENNFIAARMDVLSNCRPFLVEIVKDALFSGDRVTALGIALLLEARERQRLLGPLLAMAGLGNGLSDIVKRIIFSIPREWLLANLDAAAEPVLIHASPDEYQNILNLYGEIDRDLAIRLARKIASGHDPSIRSIGESFLENIEES